VYKSTEIPLFVIHQLAIMLVDKHFIGFLMCTNYTAYVNTEGTLDEINLRLSPHRHLKLIVTIAKHKV
jgi:hypothetical protein